MNRPSDHKNPLLPTFGTIGIHQSHHCADQIPRVTTTTSTSFSPEEPTMIDYGYEDHKPSPKRQYETKKIVPSNDLMLASPYSLEATDSTTTTSCGGAADDSFSYPELNESDFPPIPADRQARKQRSFHRRGGEGHSALLRAAVMASMDSQEEEQFDSDDAATTSSIVQRRSGRNSDISLVSLQEALSETTSPRKRARHTDSTSRSFSSIDFESEEEQNTMETPEETTEDDYEEEEDCGLQFSGDEDGDEDGDDDLEEDEQVAQATADLDTLAMNSSFTKLRKNHRRSYSGNLRMTSSLLSNTSTAALLNSSVSSLPNVRSYSTGTRCPPGRGPRRWVSRRTSYDSWASAASDDYSADS
jgi:hypothetical protein